MSELVAKAEAFAGEIRGATRQSKVYRANGGRVQNEYENTVEELFGSRSGFIVEALWEAGLKRLTYREIRGFLKAAGFSSIPRTKALGRHIQRMGLKRNSSG